MSGLFFMLIGNAVPALKNFLDDPQLVGMDVSVGVKNPGLIQAIDAHFSVGMQDVVVFHNQPDMGDFTLGVVKKRQIARSAFFDKTQGFPQEGLVFGVPWNGGSAQAIHHLSESAAIDPKRSFAAP